MQSVRRRCRNPPSNESLPVNTMLLSNTASTGLMTEKSWWNARERGHDRRGHMIVRQSEVLQ